MHYTSFRICNFKGVKDATVDLRTVAGASVFAFVGLNESGKTTILEAIHSFSPDDATSELMGGAKAVGVPYEARVPRHELASFTGDVKVEATVALDESDRERIVAGAADELRIVVDSETIQDSLIFSRIQRFQGGDFKNNYFDLTAQFKIKTGKQRSFRDPNQEEKHKLKVLCYDMAPKIAYFPTFVFDFPKAIYLTQRGGAVDRFYRRVFQDILDYDAKGYTIEDDIVRRVRNPDLVLPWLNFFPLWTEHGDRGKIQQVMDRASAAVTKLVFGRWNEIFGEDVKGKEITISYDVVEGKKRDEQGTWLSTNEHDVRAKFQIKDGTRRFDVNHRSLGFRWFFAFMLFTQFRVARTNSRPLLFLFDEPAANLHAAAQNKLIDCFPEIASSGHALAYSTHSHYMIEPKWLEQTFIVSNRSDAPTSSILDEVSLDDESLDIKATLYRDFVNRHPNQVSYFQPVLDRLNVVPSRFDYKKDTIVLEGKSDYYILRYGMKMLSSDELPLVPALEAGTFGALSALSSGWSLNSLFVLDSDKKGKEEKSRYSTEFGIPLDRIVTISDVLADCNEIEDLLDEKAREKIKKELQITSKLTKKHILRFFQERLASNNVESLGTPFKAKIGQLIGALQKQL